MCLNKQHKHRTHNLCCQQMVHLLGRLQVFRMVGEQFQCEIRLFEYTRHEVRVGVRLHCGVTVH